MLSHSTSRLPLTVLRVPCLVSVCYASSSLILAPSLVSVSWHAASRSWEALLPCSDVAHLGKSKLSNELELNGSEILVLSNELERGGIYGMTYGRTIHTSYKYSSRGTLFDPYGSRSGSPQWMNEWVNEWHTNELLYASWLRPPRHKNITIINSRLRKNSRSTV